jgi:hypothetical protein
VVHAIGSRREAMYGGLLKAIYQRYRRQYLPLGLSDMFVRD